MAIFLTFFFLGNIGQENVKTRSSKTQKIEIFPNGLTNDLVQKWPLFQLLFLGNQSRENVLYYILQRKYPFLGYKNKKFKKSKNWDFSKGVTHGFGPKMAIFPTLFVGNKNLENVSYDILKRKNAFLGYKNQKFKKSKSWHFSIFFSLGNIGQENVFYDIIEGKNAFLGYKNKKF